MTAGIESIYWECRGIQNDAASGELKPGGETPTIVNGSRSI